jgi:hypothetical protein
MKNFLPAILLTKVPDCALLSGYSRWNTLCSNPVKDVAGFEGKHFDAKSISGESEEFGNGTRVEKIVNARDQSNKKLATVANVQKEMLDMVNFPVSTG